MSEHKQNNKLEELFNKLQLSEEERSYLYIVMTEYVAKEMDALLTEVLSEEDFQKLDVMVDENEAEAYMSNRFKEEVGKTPQQASDEILMGYIENLQIQGIKELLERQKHH